MARVLVLDSGPLGDACRSRGRPDVDQLTLWWIQARANGAMIIIPEIADYEIRRELVRAGARAGIRRLDRLRDELAYVPITTEAMRRAADLWAEARNKGYATSDPTSLDGDVILAAQALAYSGIADAVTVVTYNAAHLSRYLDARHWRTITP